jgi:predicted ArsR family transcriptional regulator
MKIVKIECRGERKNTEESCGKLLMHGAENVESQEIRAALAQPARARLYRALAESERGLTADELSRVSGLHPNTVRWHVARLQDAGLVEREARNDARPGRPPVVFRARPLADEAAEFRLLAGALTGALTALPDGADRAEQAGFELGHALMSEPADAAQSVQRIHALLERQGFKPKRDRGEIEMRRCPFLDLVLVDAAHAAVVCGLHRGIVAGGLEGMGSPLDLETFEPFATPTSCLVRLAPRRVAPAG